MVLLKLGVKFGGWGVRGNFWRLRLLTRHPACVGYFVCGLKLLLMRYGISCGTFVKNRGTEIIRIESRFKPIHFFSIARLLLR